MRTTATVTQGSTVYQISVVPLKINYVELDDSTASVDNVKVAKRKLEILGY